MTQQESIHTVGKWLAIIVFIVGLVIVTRYFCVQSYRISTDAMEEALHKGDYVLVNKLSSKNNPGRNRVVLFRSPLQQDSLLKPLFVSRCIGMPGDTIAVHREGYKVNGETIPRSPLSLNSYLVKQMDKSDFLTLLSKLNIPPRELEQTSSGFTLKLTSFEEYQLREELTNTVELVANRPVNEYSLIVPRKNRFYQLDETSLIACKEAIMSETNGKAIFRNGKLYMDGRETNFFFFRKDYYWVLSDNPEEAIDSRHLGFIPADYMIGNAWFCWYSKDRQRIFKSIY